MHPVHDDHSFLPSDLRDRDTLPPPADPLDLPRDEVAFDFVDMTAIVERMRAAFVSGDR